MSDDRVVSIEKRENGLIATMQCKEMDFGASEALKEAVAKAIAEGPGKRCVIDMSAVVFLPSVGIGILLQLLNESKARGGEFVLVGVNSEIREVLRITAVEKLFDFRDDLAVAFD